MKKLIFLIFIAVASSCLAVPHWVNYQGYLADSAGVPLDTTVDITFRIYHDFWGGTPVWDEIHTATVINGYFNVVLGSADPLSANIFDVSPMYLGIAVGNDAEMTPLTPFAAVPYSFRVSTVDSASGGTITGDINITDCLNVGSSNTASGQLCSVTGGSNNESSGMKSHVGGGRYNHARGSYSVVGGGGGFSATDSNSAIGSASAIGGGQRCVAIGSCATVGGGYHNIAGEFVCATVAGGESNTASGRQSSVGGGLHNTASGVEGTVGGGENNESSGSLATVGGGRFNTASGSWATVPGGYKNVAEGDHTFSAGDSANAVGDNSFTLGTRIVCAAESSFVWSDGSGPTMSIGSSRTFNVKASAGTRIWTNSGLTSGVTIGAGGNSWVGVCDSTKKRNIRLLNTQDILNRFSSLPLKRWEYKSEDQGVEHIGPMAQDFWNSFHLGNDSLGISSIDADGIALAAIQELAKQNSELEKELATLRAQVQSLLAKDGHTTLVKEK